MKEEVIELEAIWYGGGFHFILQEDKTGLVLRKFDADFDERGLQFCGIELQCAYGCLVRNDELQ